MQMTGIKEADIWHKGQGRDSPSLAFQMGMPNDARHETTYFHPYPSRRKDGDAKESTKDSVVKMITHQYRIMKGATT